MSSSYFSCPETWRIPTSVVTDSLIEMAIDGKDGNEGIVLWLGRDEGDVAQVTHLVRFRGPLIQKRPQFINIHPSLLNDVADVAMDHGVRLIGQVHSHGPGYRLDLSPTDREDGIKVPYYLSLVAPDYGRTVTPIEQWGVHVFTEAAGYVRLGPGEIRQRFQVVPGPQLPFFTIGGAAC